MPAVSVLILLADHFSAESLRHYVLLVYPGAACRVVSSIEGAEPALASGTIDLFITATDFSGEDVLDSLLVCRYRGWSAVQTLIITSRSAARQLVTLRELGVNGVFDVSTEPAESIAHALRTLGAGRSYWSANVRAQLTQQPCRIVCHQLAPSEQLGLAIIGDGCGDDVASDRLNMTLSTVRSLRRNLHAKLSVHDRHEIIQRAAQLGYTRFTAKGVVAFGLAIVVTEYLTRSKRPVSLPPELLVRCRIGPGAIVLSGNRAGFNHQRFSRK